MRGPTVWIMVHDLSRTGVPIVLERLLRATGGVRDGEVHVIARVDGPMRARIAPLVASLHVLEPETGRSAPGAVAAALRTIDKAPVAARLDAVRWRHRCSRLPAPDVVLLHGAGAWSGIAAVPTGVPVVVHLHELDSALARCVPTTERRDFLAGVDRVMAVCGPVATMAVRHGADANAVVVVPGVADDGPIATGGVPERSDTHDRSRVLGAGRPGWRKGTDRLAGISYELARRQLDVDVGWVGGRPSGAEGQWVDAPDPVRWIDECPDPWSELSAASAIVVPSREDPLPLVVLEAGRRGHAVVATATGGLPDLLGSDRGLVADRQRVASITDQLERVLRSEDLAASLGGALAEHVHRHHRPQVVGPLWWDVITDAAARPGRGDRVRR